MNNKIGCAMSSFTNGYPIEIFPELLKEIGFDTTFVTFRDYSSLDAITKYAQKVNLEISSLHAPFQTVSRMWTDDAKEELALQKQSVDYAVAYGVNKVVIHPFIGFGIPNPTEYGYRNFLELCDYAENKQVLLAIENVEGEAYLDYLLQKLKGHPALGFCLDIGHEYCYNHGRDMLLDYGDIWKYVHIDSNLGDHGNTWRDDFHYLPYDGNVNIDFFVERIKKYKFQGDLILEIKKDPKYVELDLNTYLSKAYEQVSKIKKMVDA